MSTAYIYNSSGIGFNWAVGKLYSIIVSILYIYFFKEKSVDVTD